MSSRVEQLQLLLQKKRDAEQKALQLVIALLETGISREFLVGAAKHINLEYYSDVTTERAISFTCGYPLCDKRLTNVPHQRYRISLRQKKVYDLSELKNFCSDQCFRASKYFEAQLSTSPVWLLDEEQSERVVRPSLIDDPDPVSSSFDTAAATPRASSRRGCTSADRAAADSAAVVVNVGDIAARVDDLSLLDNDAAESAAAMSRSSLDRSSNFRPRRPGDVTTPGQLRSPPPATTGREMSPASSKQATNAPGRVPECLADRRHSPSSQLVTGAQPWPSTARMPPSQVAFNRLMEWCTEATTAWLLNTDVGSQGSSSAAAAATVEGPLTVETSSANDGDCSNGTSSAADRGNSTSGPEACVTTGQLPRDLYTQRALHFLVAGDRRVATAVGAKEAAALSGDAPPDDGRIVPPSEAHSQEAIRRRIVTERLTKSIEQAEAVVGANVIANLRSRNLSRLVASFKLTKDNATMKPSEWLLTVLMLAYLITLSDEATNRTICTALSSYGYTSRDLELIRQRFCGDANR